jgi:hypothetical protein
MNIDLLKYTTYLKTKTEDDRQKIWDITRKKWLILQPEEFIRQLIVTYLIEELKFPIGFISIEKGAKSLRLQQRYDLLIYDPHLKPFMLIECKAFSQSLGDKVDSQIARYNLQIIAPYICLTNGNETRCYIYENNEYSIMDSFPKYPTFDHSNN